VQTDSKLKTKAKRNPKPEIDVLRADSLAAIPWLIHGFSTRIGGFSKAHGGRALNLGFTAHDSHAAVERNRQAFAAALVGKKKSGAPWPIVTVRQIHSDLIHRVSKISETPPAGDGLLTNSPGILLGVMTADCLPIILADSKRHAVGVFHAGWRGTVKRIVEKGVGEMRKHFSSRPGDLKAVIGPGIRSCCYQVGTEVRDAFESQFSYAKALFRHTKETDEIHEKYPLLFLTSRAPGHSELPQQIFLDLAAANRRQLLDAGVLKKNISEIALCTACRTDLLFSHRGEHGVTGRMMAVAGIRKLP
jgi:YfiH family protein